MKRATLRDHFRRARTPIAVVSAILVGANAGIQIWLNLDLNSQIQDIINKTWDHSESSAETSRKDTDLPEDLPAQQ
ncbi:hypothetical protein [Moorena sp. SIO3I6]|uniref:hypothetical protein n=1 Tax=Moorena sp. SIO3I6 TaxID=2607831 RepID=UPI0013F7F633|nr:hypothetical protein [Moorena sp. SIO3I6]NEP29601.1 hypothetical protein [Moorena sp. SIO3I6]